MVDTLKTAFVVVLLLAVLYGVYVVLNKPVQPLPVAEPWQSEPIPALDVDLGGVVAPLDASELASANPTPEAETSSAWPMPSSMPIDSRPGSVTQSPAPGGIAAATPSVAAPDLLAVEVAEERPLASELADQQWPSGPGEAATQLPGHAVVPDNNLADTGSQPTSLERDVPPPGTEVDAVDPRTSAVSSYAPAVGSSPESELSPGAYSPFESAIQSAATKAQSEQWHDALWTLSLFYGSSDLNDRQRQVLQDWLDPLAAKVIYSQEHLIENPYTVQAADTLQSIADDHRVPWQLLANINGLQNSQEIQAGSTLKVIRGPMRAEVDLSQNHLTVFVGKLYAGRFSISAGQEPAPQPGEYQVQEKLPGRTYYAGDGQTIPPEDPANPFGQVWLDLGNELCIHGSPSSGGPADRRGCISLSAADANDLFGILSKGSSVAILR